MFLSILAAAIVVSSFSAVAILLIRKWFGRHLTAIWRYRLWLFLFMALTLPFIPMDFNQLNAFFEAANSYLPASGSADAASGSATASGRHLIQDFSVSVDQWDLPLFNTAAIAVWLLGALSVTFMLVRGWLRLRKITAAAFACSDPQILNLLEECKERMKLIKPINIIYSDRVHSPMIYGLVKTTIILPASSKSRLSLKQHEYIFLHELSHFKNKDLLTNCAMLFYQVMYWFNPLIWLAFREMRMDREIACDAAVLKRLDPDAFSAYGHTLIDFLDRSKRAAKLPLMTPFNDSKIQLKKRIKEISAFSHSEKQSKGKSFLIYALSGFLLMLQVPVVSAFSMGDNDYSFNIDGAIIEEFEPFFRGFEGSFVLYDQQSQQYHLFNAEKSTVRVSPASTYKIYSALFALETKAITPESSTLPWDGTEQSFEEWEKDQNVSSALQQSVNWYFHTIDRKNGLDAIEANLHQLHYGNADVSGGVDQFWQESSLKISPIEQVQLLQAFFDNQLGYGDRSIRTVKNALRLDTKNGARLSGKTGTGTVNGKDVNGWFIGYVEKEANTYFFATNLEGKDGASGSKAAAITQSVLQHLEIY